MDNKMLFVCGFPSGGTDLIKTILNAHPDIFLSGEMPALSRLAEYGFGPETRFNNLDDLSYFRQCLLKLDVYKNISNIDHDFGGKLHEREFLSMDEVLRICFHEDNECKKIWGNKTPQNTEKVRELHELFPSACFLMIARDVRDVCLSWDRKWGKDMIWCAHKWSQRMSAGLNDLRALEGSGLNFITIRYEDLIRNTESVCREICDFLGLEFSVRMIEHHLHTKEKIDGKINYGQALMSQNSEKWRKSIDPDDLCRIEEICFDGMQLFRYEPSLASGKVSITKIELFRGILNDFFRAFLTGNRVSNQNSMMNRLKSLRVQLGKIVHK
jgi:hypothetical protein